MIKLYKPLLLLSSLIWALQALAAEDSKIADTKYYDVEIIIFKNVKVPVGREVNLPTPSATIQPGVIDLSDAKGIQQAAKNGFTALEKNEFRLQQEANHITRSSRYKLLMHTAWRQPGLAAKQSLPVWIKGGGIFDSGYSSIDQAKFIVSQLKSDDTRLLDNEQNRIKGHYELEGLITITLSRYLHTRAELVLRKPVSPNKLMQQSELSANDSSDIPLSEQLEGQLLLNYELKEQRRMRSKRLHYLDHPQFGMLVLITPFEKSVEQADSAPQTSSLPGPVMQEAQ